MSTPITYIPDFLPANGGYLFHTLSNELAWVRHGTVPRMEYYVNTVGTPYTYGVEKYARIYNPQPMHKAIETVKVGVELVTGVEFEVCFLNRYLNQSDHLGWHSDNSPEMDDSRPIAIVSFGVPREIWFRNIPELVVNDNEQEDLGQPTNKIEKLLLEDCSLCIMAPGMQDTHQHRIPKAGKQCGERISLTFRGYTK